VSVTDEADSMAGRQQLVTERTLQLVERQIGRGELPSEQDWDELRQLAGDNLEARRLVDELRSVVRRFDEQLRAGYGSEVDLVRLRHGLSHLLRDIVREKSGSTVSTAREAN
jgi:hypothetical protein